MRAFAGVAPVAVAAVIAACGAGQGAAERRSGGDNEAAARSDAAALLAALKLPPGAQRSSSEPAGDGGVLARPARREATPAQVDEHAWWRVPGSPRAVLAYIDAHKPAGTRRTLSGHGGPPPTLMAGYERPPMPGVLGHRSLVLEAVRLAGGGTGLRADAEVVWIVPRRSGATIPKAVRRLRVTVTDRSTEVQGPIAIRSRRKVRRAAAVLEALPAAQPGAVSCPNDGFVRIRLTFYGRAGGTPLARAVVDPGGCGGAELRIRGKRPQELGGDELPRKLVRRIERALGVHLRVGR